MVSLQEVRRFCDDIPAQVKTKKKPKKTRRSYLALAIGTGFIAFLIGFNLILPLYDVKKDVEVEYLEENNININIAEEVIVGEPYIYKHFIPPENSFGARETVLKFVNWSYFWKFFNKHSAWQLEAWNPYTEEWIDSYQGTNLNEWLTITRSRSADNSSEKIGLNVTNNGPIDTFFRFKFGIDARVKDYVNRSGQYEYTLNYPVEEEVYSVVFNWSDVIPDKQAGKISLNHGIKNIEGKDVFYFIIRGLQKLPVGQSYFIDPYFGVTNGSATSARQLEDAVIGTKCVAPMSGTVTHVNVMVQNFDALDPLIGIMYYGGSQHRDSYKLSNQNTDGAADNSIVSLPLTMPLEVEEGDIVIACGWANAEMQIREDATMPEGDWGGGYYYEGDSCCAAETGGTWDTHGTGSSVIAYVTYIPFNQEPSIGNPQISNNSINVSISPTFNITVNDLEGDNCNVTFYTSEDGSAWTHKQTNISVAANASYSFVYTEANSISKTYYVKVNANDTQGNNVSSIYIFQTTPYSTDYFNFSLENTSWVYSYYNMSAVISGFLNYSYGNGGVTNIFFDSFEDAGIDGDITTIGNWSDGGGDYEWKGGDCNTPSSNTGMLSCNDGSRFIYTEASSRYSADYFLDSDTFTGSSNVSVELKVGMDGTTCNEFKIQIWDGSEWDTLYTLSGDNGQTWIAGNAYSENGNSAPYTETTKIRLYGQTGISYLSDICVDTVYINSTSSDGLEGFFISEPIFKPDGKSWDKLYIDVNDTDHSSFSLIDPNSLNYNISSDLTGNGDDISSVTNNSVCIWGYFTGGDVSTSSFNITWSEGGEPPEEEQYYQGFYWSFDYGNTSADKQAYYWSFDYSNSSANKQGFYWSFDYGNSSADKQGFYWSFDYRNTSIYYTPYYWSFDYGNTSAYNQGFYWSFDYSNSVTYNQAYYWSFDYSNTSAEQWYNPYYWSFDYGNSSDINQAYYWSFDYGNSSADKQGFYWSFDYGNSSADKQAYYWSFGYSNTSPDWNQAYYWAFDYGNSTPLTYIIISGIYPGNNTLNIPLQPNVYATFEQIYGDEMNISFYYGNSLNSTDTLLTSFNNIYNSTQTALLFTASNKATNYYWRIQADDGDTYTNQTLTFKSEYNDVGAFYPVSNNSYALIGLLGLVGLIAVLWRKKKDKDEDEGGFM